MEELKKCYYPAYAQALHMLLHPEEVTQNNVSTWVKRCGKTVFNRLFCLVVWQENRRQRAGTPSMEPNQYKCVITELWNLFRDYADGDGSDQYWDEIVDRLRQILAKYGYSEFVKNVAVNVTLEEIERINRRKMND